MSILSSQAEQQQAFAAAVLARDMQAAPLQALFVGAPDHITRRLGVYRANLQAARAGALQAAFPTVRQIVGDEFFNALAREYGHAHPSSQGNLNHMGAALAAFLQGFAPAAELPYLSDVARLDWAMHKADSAADVPALSAHDLSQQLGAHAAKQVHITLHPAVALVSSRYPLHDIWQYNQWVSTGAAHDELQTPDWTQAQSVIVHRAQWRASAALISHAEAAALQALQQGQSLHQALGLVIESGAQVELAQMLANWCSMGILVKVMHP